MMFAVGAWKHPLECWRRSDRKRFRRGLTCWCGVLVGVGLAGPMASGGGFERAIETASSRVVKLYGLGAGLQAGYGTGIVISDDGLVLTVLSLLVDARSIRAVAWDGSRFEAEVVRRDLQRQLVLLRLRPEEASAGGAADDGGRTNNEAAMRDAGAAQGEARGMLYFDLEWGIESDGEKEDTAPRCATALEPGEWVLAAGNPFKVADGPEPVSVVRGVYSTRTHLDARRRVRDFPYTGEVLVVDAITSNPGGEGSALVNLEGALLGMVGRVVVSNRTHTHLNYAVPCEVLRAFLRESLPVDGESLAIAPTVSDPESIDYGIRVARTGYQKVLPFVERVRRGSPAARAGVRADDLILSVNGRTIADVADYDARVSSLAPDRPVELVLRRGREILTVIIEPEGGR